MRAQNSRILAKFHAKRRQPPSGLFGHLDLIKEAWEVYSFGVPTIIKVLREADVAEGLSLANVQGFIGRARKKELIGEKGCRKDEIDEDVFDESSPKSEKISSPVDEHSEPAAAAAKKETKVSNPKRKPKASGQKSAHVVGAENVPKHDSTQEKEIIGLPEKGPIDEKTWLAFAKSRGYPLDSSGNIAVNEYAQLLDQEGVEMLEDSDYQDLAGFTISWRTHPERNISETWAVNVAQKAATLKRQIRRAVGLE